MLRFHTRVAFLNGRRAEALDLIMPALLGGEPRLNRHHQCFLGSSCIYSGLSKRDFEIVIFK